MDHDYIAANGLVERYRQGTLQPDEEARFEEHFLGCPECTQQLELARGFRSGLKTMVAEDVARAAAVQAVVQAGLFAWLARRGRAAQWGVALAALLVVFALGALPVLRWREEAANLRRTAAALQERGNAQERAAADLQKRLAGSEERRRELESKLAQTKPPAAPRGLAASVANLSVALLTAVRGPGEPPATIDLAKSGDLVALAVDPGAGARFETYRVTLTRAGAAVFQKSGLKPNALETVMIAFPASFFTPGEYRLRLEGVKADGTAAEIGGYPFRVVGKR
ncbi:MAG TPA: zf-HC2 domain-containing protein [Thermoanaerobaculia bacterium]|nr:zf-HC2 domain-containing protein [Thermoanaerobaculia bacterium]